MYVVLQVEAKVNFRETFTWKVRASITPGLTTRLRR
jgi:hypothetical protein